jgi:uncharacterized CHY-type Zn-finger protein
MRPPKKYVLEIECPVCKSKFLYDQKFMSLGKHWWQCPSCDIPYNEGCPPKTKEILVRT